MSDQKPPSSHNKGDIHIGGSVKGGDFALGHGNVVHIVKSAYEGGKPTIDVDELKKTLLELHKSLEAAALPDDAKVDAQVAASQARKVVGQQDMKTEELVNHIKEAGDALQSAGATIVGPLVVGGAKVVAGWFGLPLP